MDNRLVTVDPALGVRKHLDVQYSYGDGVVHYVSGKESTPEDIVCLVLPESSEVKKSKKPSLPPSQTVHRLRIIIKDGYFGTPYDHGNTRALFLKVKVDGVATTLKEWTLNLERGGKPWKAAYQQPIPKEKTIEFVPGIKGLANIDKDPKFRLIPPAIFDPLVPSHGWLHFTVECSDARFSDLVFGATFVLVAIEEENYKSTCTQLAGEWLHPAVIVTY